MKRTFGISVKRSKNYQSVEVNASFECEDIGEKDFNILKEQTINDVHTQVNLELKKLDKKFNLEV